jgi:hypothetical protein
MVLSEPEIEEELAQNDSWLAFLQTGNSVLSVGRRIAPIEAQDGRSS